MASVSSLAIKIQTGTDNTALATWNFKQSTVVVKNPSVKVGSWVNVKSGSKWYNGTSIASFVFSSGPWKVIELSGQRAVINQNQAGTHKIMSPINVNNLTTSGSSSSSTTITENTVDHYEVKWSYDSGDGIWFSGSSSTDEKNKYSTYSIPENALKVRVQVKPVSKTRKVNGKDTSYWSGSWTSATYNTNAMPPEVPPSPSVEVDKYTMTVTVDNVSDPRSDEIHFEVYDMTTLFRTGYATVKACMATFQCALNAGGQYRVRARSANIYSSSKIYSDWTDFTSDVITVPAAPSGITTIRGASSTSVYLEWGAVNSAETYELEYTTNVDYFDGSNETTSVTGIEFNHYTVTGLETGDEYFFRVRAVNDQGESAWTEIKSVVIGKTPAAPTTWSSVTTVITGDPLYLYWVHNAEDGSTETYAEVEITVGDDTQTHTVKNEMSDDEENPDKDKTKYYTVDTSEYEEGAQIKWRVRTAGITLTYGDWSIMRTVDVYAPPTLALTVTDKDEAQIQVVEEFPFFLKGLAGPSTQMPIGYHVTISANQGYETVDNIGRTKIVNAGDAVYSRYIDTNDPLLVELDPSNIDLENNIEYSVSVIVSMNSGLTATATAEFSVSWTDATYTLDAEISVDPDTFIAYITPYCRDEEGVVETDATLAVYRREFDGTYQEIATGIDPTKNTVVTDPHPALDYARYRLVATSTSTGAVSFYDPPGYPVDGTGAVLQWEEEWSDFDVTDEDNETVIPLWSGSMLKLPYNLDVTDNISPESTTVKYIGRSYPVSYYGTQIESASVWNLEIPADDKDTIYALRRLQIWKGDVYVREATGSGYWATVGVSFTQTHQELTVPITLTVTRVEGGM